MATVLISSTFLQHFQLDRHDFFFVENILSLFEILGFLLKFEKVDKEIGEDQN